MLKLSRPTFYAKCCLLGHALFLVAVSLAIAVLAVMLALRYWFLPDIERYHTEVAALASRAVGLPVSIGKIEADWSGLRPHLIFSDVHLMDAHGNTALSLRRVENVVSWTTLFSGELRLNKLEISEPNLLIRRDQQGVLHVAGFEIADTSSDGKLSDWLLHQHQIVLRNGQVTWQDDLNAAPLLTFKQMQVRVLNSGRHHQFSVRLSPPQIVSAPVDLRGDFFGESFSETTGWRGEVFAQIAAADTDAWGQWWKLPEAIRHAQGSMRVWMGFEKGTFSRVTADLDVKEVQGRVAADLPAFDLRWLRGRVGGGVLAHGFEVFTKQLVLSDGKTQLRPTDFYLRLSGAHERIAEAGEIKANAIELTELGELTKYFPLTEPVRAKLHDFSPRGRIADLHAQWQGENIEQAHYDFKAHFDNFSLQRVGSLPGVEALTGQVSGNDGGGNLTLNSPHLKVNATQWLLEPLTFDTFNVLASWQHKRDGWSVKLSNLTVSNEDLSGTANGTYSYEGKGLGVADASLHLTRASVRHVARYLPKEQLGKETMAWLQSGLLGGQAFDTHLRLRGDLNDFPFPENKKGLFQVKAKATGAMIDYAQDWPRIENATATLLIEGKKLQVDASSATVAGAQAQKAQVVIPDLMSAEPVILVHGVASGETKHGLNFIKHSPVRAYINGFTDNSTAVGEGVLDLNIEIPLSNKPLKLNGNYHFNDNEISLGQPIPVARRVTGDLSFTDTTLTAKEIRVQVLGGPAVVAIQTAVDGALKVKMQGKLNIEAWRKTESSPLLKPLSGETDWEGEVFVKKNQYSVIVSSNLHGLSADFPQPFVKRSNELVPLKFELRGAGPTQDVIWLQYGELLNARLVSVLDQTGHSSIKRGYVNFGSARRMIDKEGIWVSGTVPILSLEGWDELMQVGGGDAVDVPTIDGVDLTVQKLIGYGANGAPMAVHARNRNGVISAQLSSKDLNGELSWFPQGKGKLVARLKNANWAEGEKDKKTEVAHPPAPAKTNGKMRSAISMPVIDVAIDHFIFQGKVLGRMEMHATQVEKDIVLDQLRITNPDGVLTASGKWGMSPQQSHIAIKFDLLDVGKILFRSGFPNSMKNGSGTLECDLVWAGAPDELLLANLDGHLNLKMSKGQFLKIDSNAGKLLSVLNLQSLPKRITLDFTDVFSKGFEFDSITGDAQIRQGVLLTRDFKIVGSAAQVGMTGQIDLNRETQNLRVKVLPTIGDSVSLLAFAAGPAVGAGVYIANKMLRDPLDKLVSFEYNVTGGWADPKVEKVGQGKVPPNNFEN